MSDNYYSEINLHLVWHTNLSHPFLKPDVEAMTITALREKAASLGNNYVHEIGGTENHIHLAVSIEPTVTISELIGMLKGYSSHEVNRRVGLGRTVLQWQTGYGVVSFGTRNLDWIKEYIRNQKERHAGGKVQDRLERITDPEAVAQAEPREAP